MSCGGCTTKWQDAADVTELNFVSRENQKMTKCTFAAGCPCGRAVFMQCIAYFPVRCVFLYAPLSFSQPPSSGQEEFSIYVRTRVDGIF